MFLYSYVNTYMQNFKTKQLLCYWYWLFKILRKYYNVVKLHLFS